MFISSVPSSKNFKNKALLYSHKKVLFWLPPESPAKMILGMNIFTSFFVLLLLLSKNVPSATDKIPLIGAYYCLNMVMIAGSTCACTVVVHIYFRGNGKVPYILRKIFLQFLARILCMEGPPIPKHRERPFCIDQGRGELYNNPVTSSNKIPQALDRSSKTLANLDNTVKQQRQQIYERYDKLIHKINLKYIMKNMKLYVDDIQI